jgi:uncharacterized protein DUF5670
MPRGRELYTAPINLTLDPWWTKAHRHFTMVGSTSNSPSARMTVRRDVVSLSYILWIVVVVLVVLWLLGFLVAHVGSIIHLLLLIALVVILYNLFVGRRSAV